MLYESMSDRRTGRSVHVAVGIGSNVGDRLASLRFAEQALRGLLEETRTSAVYETEPKEVTDQPRFLNACCVGRTDLPPRELLGALLELERRAGRRAGPRYGPRTLDLDLLLYGTTVVEEPDLVVPHPRMRQRGFVLVPLAELVPGWEVPASRGFEAASVAQLASVTGEEGVQRLEIEWS